ncbi:MAG: hypothetical protein LBJ08_09390, partial [Bifidobacteriaceae bacterium]|nr:hypothetical protein [Bifidobacteriaceae bacterium]
QPLCRLHHRLKTLAGWTWERDLTTGITTIVSALGQTHRMPRRNLDETLTHIESSAPSDKPTACHHPYHPPHPGPTLQTLHEPQNHQNTACDIRPTPAAHITQSAPALPTEDPTE